MRRKLRIAIIGAGPAGIAAAIQLKRSGIDPIVFEEYRIGGLLKNAHRIENYPGFPKGVSGDTLVQNLKDHVSAWSIAIEKQHVKRIERSKDRYIIHARRIYRADIVIVASGTKPVLPNTDHESFPGRVFFEIDAIKKTRNKNIIIVGGGDAAYDYALHLGHSNKILIVNRRNHTRALPLLVRRVRNVRSIKVINNATIRTIGMSDNELQVVIAQRNQKRVIECDYIVYAIGRIPSCDYLSERLMRKFPDGDRTLYFIGDVKNGAIRQVAIAVGDGVKAAMEIVARYLAKR